MLLLTSLLFFGLGHLRGSAATLGGAPASPPPQPAPPPPPAVLTVPAALLATALPTAVAAAAAELSPSPPLPPPPAAALSEPAALPVLATARPTAGAAAAAELPPPPPPPLPRTHAIVMTAVGSRTSVVDLTVTLSSLAAHVPGVTVVLLMDAGSAAAAAAVALAAPAAGAPPGAPPRLWLRIYSWAALSARLAAAHLALRPALRRFLLYPLILDELAAAGGGAGDDAALVLFSNLDAARARVPAALLLSDARDVAFERDPFPDFWRAFADVPEAVGAALLLVASELDAADGATRLGLNVWNRQQVHACAYDLGESMVYERVIHCDGTSIGTAEGVRRYVALGMAPAYAACEDVHASPGIDQAVHNLLTHAYTDAQLASWRERARAGGPFVDEGPTRRASPVMTRPLAMLDAVEALRAAVDIRVARSEDGVLCTLALHVRFGRLLRDAEGRVLALDDPATLCAVVHQYDRERALVEYYRGRYPVAAAAVA